jgi:hypothetical protein
MMRWRCKTYHRDTVGEVAGSVCRDREAGAKRYIAITPTRSRLNSTCKTGRETRLEKCAEAIAVSVAGSVMVRAITGSILL